MFELEYLNNKKILLSDYLDKSKVKHLFTTRETVVTPKDVVNLKEISKKNLEEIAKYLSIEPQNIIIPEQTHSANIRIAKKNTEYPDTDALVTDSKDIAILLNFADCTPVILYDEINNVGAVAHAGWKGTAQSIAAKTVIFMQKNYGTNPGDVTAVIGPAISLNNYQVDRNVFDKLKCTLNNQYNDFYTEDKATGKFNVDLKTINQHQLEELGISRIDKCKYCTYDSIDVFFSYRREAGKTARHSAILKLI